MSSPAAASPAKAKKAEKKAAPKKVPEHPKYVDMVAAAIAALKERKGSSRQAILKYVCANYPVNDSHANTYVKAALKSAVASGLLKQPKGTGASGSFKLGEKPKAVKKPATKKPAAKKPAAKKPAAKKATPKKVKKATPKKTKKPTPKKAKKPAAKKPAAKKPARRS